MAASAGLSCRVAERGERVLHGCFPGCMWHLSSNSQRTGNPTLVKSAQRERISGNQKFKECRNFGGHCMKGNPGGRDVMYEDVTCIGLLLLKPQLCVTPYTGSPINH